MLLWILCCYLLPAAPLAEPMTAPVIFFAVPPVAFVIFFAAPLALVALPWAFAELIVLSATITKAANNTVAAIMKDICFCTTLYDAGTEFNHFLYISSSTRSIIAMGGCVTYH